MGVRAERDAAVAAAGQGRAGRVGKATPTYERAE